MQTVPPSKPYSLKDWQGGNCSLKQEFDYWIEDIDGEIPPELNGTLFRNAPGLANTNVIHRGGKLMALWEASHPHCPYLCQNLAALKKMRVGC